MIASVFIKNFIKGWEKLRLNPYQDGGGIWTTGWGHLILPHEKDLFKEITTQRAEELFSHDIWVAEKCINTYVKVKLTQNQFDSLTSFVFNEGITTFIRSPLLKKLNIGDFPGASQEFMKYIYIKKRESKGLKDRRKQEQEIFNAR